MTSHPLQPVGTKAQAVNFRATPPLALYIHIPWCVRKCPYCDFNSHEVRGSVPEKEYVAALVRDLELALPLIWGRKVCTVFFGGGTPSLLSGESVAEILRQVRMLLPLDLGAEVTLEANPGTVEAGRFAAYREAGVNRLSLGIQSFNDAHLMALGRIHSADETRRAIAIAQQHFDNINLDLMYALPSNNRDKSPEQTLGQTLEQALQDTQTALSFAPQHLSCYHLTLEPNTPFYRNPPPLPDDDASSEMQGHIEELLAARGYEHYETSAFALLDTLSPTSLPQAGESDAVLLRKPVSKWRSRHNLNYWQFGDYLGIGAGAHSKLSFYGRVMRQARHKQPQAYLDAVAQGKPVQEEHEVAPADLAFEFMMNALRLNRGFEAALFQERTSLPLLAIRRELEQAAKRGLLFQDHRRIAPTRLGQRFLNDLLEIFLREKTGE